jgi:hypothetical protein
VSQDAWLPTLFHTLNNQLGIILSHAELLEAKVKDDSQKARAGEIISATLDALATSRKIRDAVDPRQDPQLSSKN